jgi:hypothetical protein
MDTEKVIIAVLLFICVVLLSIIIWVGLTKSTPEKVIVVPAPAPPQQEQSRKLPVYPEENPRYPMRTQRSAEFQQIGTLIYDDEEEPIVLPLFGRPMPTRSERWEYYTATDKQYMLKIPVVFENADCLDEIGCREVYNKDTVFIPAYKKEFKVQLYKYKDTDYIPN